MLCVVTPYQTELSSMRDTNKRCRHQVRVSSSSSISILKVFLVGLYFSLSIYFILSVHSLYIIIKIQKKNVTTFLDHEFESSPGAFYQTLDEDDAPAPPYREKTVPMTEEEDHGKEHVLYAKM